MKVGDTIYRFDQNRREYRRNDEGRSFGAPIWIKHWYEEVIRGETKVSWLVGSQYHPDKINKKRLAANELYGYSATWGRVQELAWINDNRNRIGELCKRQGDIAKLKAIAKILNYQEASNES